MRKMKSHVQKANCWKKVSFIYTQTLCHCVNKASFLPNMRWFIIHSIKHFTNNSNSSVWKRDAWGETIQNLCIMIEKNHPRKLVFFAVWMRFHSILFFVFVFSSFCSHQCKVYPAWFDGWFHQVMTTFPGIIFKYISCFWHTTILIMPVFRFNYLNFE